MQLAGYPSYGWHKHQHDTARRRLKLYAPLIESGDQEAADAFLEFPLWLAPGPYRPHGPDDGSIPTESRADPWRESSRV